MLVLGESRFATETTPVRRVVFHNFVLLTSVRILALGKCTAACPCGFDDGGPDSMTANSISKCDGPLQLSGPLHPRTLFDSLHDHKRGASRPCGFSSARSKHSAE